MKKQTTQTFYKAAFPLYLSKAIWASTEHKINAVEVSTYSTEMKKEMEWHKCRKKKGYTHFRAFGGGR